MSSIGTLLLIIGLIQFVYEKLVVKKEKTTPAKAKKYKKNKHTDIKEKIKIPGINNSEMIRQKRVEFIDREKEILTTNHLINKDTIVNDFIFSEILDKPRSKK